METIEGTDYFELANWLKNARTAIKREDYEGENNKDEAYQEALIEHFRAWEEYYRENEDFLENSEGYKKALALLALEQTVLKGIGLRIGNGKKEIFLDYEEAFKMGFMTVADIRKKKETYVDAYRKLLEELYSEVFEEQEDVEGLRRFVCEILNFHRQYEVYQLEIEDPDILKKIKACKDMKKLKQHVKDYCKSSAHRRLGENLELLPIDKISMEKFIEKLNEHELAKQTYYNYKNNDTEIGKKFFINLILFLGLSKNEAETLLMKEGFSLESSLRRAEQLTWQCIKLGTGREFLVEIVGSRTQINLDRRLFQNSMPSLAYLIFYKEQTEEQQEKLVVRYRKNLEKVEEAMLKFEVKQDKKLEFYIEKARTLQLKLSRLSNQKGELKLLEWYLETEEEKKRQIEAEIFLMGWVLDTTRIPQLDMGIKEIKKELLRLEKEEENKLLRFKELEEKIEELERRQYELKDLYPYYVSKEHYVNQEHKKYYDQIERFRFTLQDVQNYFKKELREDREIYLNKLLNT